MRTATKYALLLIAFACCTFLRAQGPESAQPQTQYTGSVSGHVYCADTNAPARFARVMLRPVGTTSSTTREANFSQSQATTGLDGSFQMQNVAPGTYYIFASLTGYLNPITQVAAADLTSTDPAAQERVARVLQSVSVNGSDGAHAEIRLARGASLSGTVLYDDGSPAVNVNVQVNLPPAASTTQPGSTSGQSFQRTDDYGRYRITGLNPGDYVVEAMSQFVLPGGFNGGPGGFGRPQSSTLMVYAPKNFRLTDAKIFTLKAGSELSGADIVIPVAAFHTVSGMAESSDGHTLNAGSLTLSDDKDKTHSFRGSVGSDGQFHFLYVPEGSYTLSLTGAAITEPNTSAGGNGRGRPRTTIVQAYGNATQSVLVENGDLSGVVVQAPPLTQSSTTPTP
jgi:hypothetical protein